MNAANQTDELSSGESQRGLTESELDIARSIIARTRPNEMTQLALDAAQLLRSSTERDEAFKDRGFFKRLAGALTGANGREARAQVGDLAQLHRIGLALIDNLQSQSLIEARAITIVRQQLQGLTEATLDSQRMLSHLVDRLTDRLAAIDSDVAMLKWRSELELRHFGNPDQPMHLWLAIVLDILPVARRQGAEFDPQALGNSLALAFGRAGITGRLTAAEFVRRLVAEVGGPEQVRIAHEVAIRAANRVVSTAELLDRIPGAGFASLHLAASELDKLARLAVDFDFDWVVNSAKIDALVAKRLGALETEYSFVELGVEVIAGHLLAEAIFEDELTDEATLQIAASPPLKSVQEDRSHLFAAHIRIETHAFAECKPTTADVSVYLDALRAYFAGSTPGEHQNSYLSALAELLGRATESEYDSAGARATPSVKELVSVLTTPELRHAWLADGLFLGCQGGVVSPAVVETFEKAARALDVRTDSTSNLLRNIPVVATSSNPSEIAIAGAALNSLSTQWRTIVQFRKISMGSAFKAATMRSHSIIWDGIQWAFELSKKSMELHNKQMDTWTIGDAGLLQRAAIAVSRTSFVWALESMFKELGERIAQVESARNILNQQLSLFGLPRVCMVEDPPRTIDLDTSYGNSEWESQTEELMLKMEKCIESMSIVAEAMSSSAEELVKQYG